MWVRIGVGITLLAVVTGAVLLAGDQFTLDHERLTEPEPTITVDRDLPASAEPGTRIRPALSFDLSEPQDVTIREKYEFNGNQQWYNFTVREVYNQTIRYTVNLPDELPETVTVSGTVDPGNTAITGDTTFTRSRILSVSYAPPDFEQLFPATVDSYDRGTVSVDYMDQLPSGGIGSGSATYTSEDGEHAVFIVAFNNSRSANRYINARFEAEDATQVEDAIDLEILYPHNGQQYHAWTRANLYIAAPDTDSFPGTFRREMNYEPQRTYQ